MQRLHIIIGIIILGVIGVIALVPYSKSMPTLVSSSQAPVGKIAVIIMKENKFNPETVQIRKGDQVIFKNDDNRQWWPASNLHPTHGIYPEFDPLKPVDPGNTWTFIFNKPGIWRYHDHLAPRILGAVEVIQ